MTMPGFGVRLKRIVEIHDVNTPPGRLTAEQKAELFQLFAEYDGGMAQVFLRSLNHITKWSPWLGGFVVAKLLVWSMETLTENDHKRELTRKYLDDIAAACVTGDSLHPLWASEPPKFSSSHAVSHYVNAAKLLVLGLKTQHPEHVTEAQHSIWTKYELGRTYVDPTEFVREKNRQFELAVREGIIHMEIRASWLDSHPKG